MKTTLLFTFFLVLFSLSATAQETELISNTGIRGAYMGSVIYPGFHVGIERPYKLSLTDTLAAKRSRTVYRQNCLVYSLGMYHHKTFHTNFFLQVEWIRKRQRSRGFYFENGFGTGISRTFLDGATFTVSDDGEVSKVSMAGNYYWITSVGGSIGYNMKMKYNKPVSVYLRANLIVMVPYNGLIYPRPTIELGGIYSLQRFRTSNSKKANR